MKTNYDADSVCVYNYRKAIPTTVSVWECGWWREKNITKRRIAFGKRTIAPAADKQPICQTVYPPTESEIRLGGDFS